MAVLFAFSACAGANRYGVKEDSLDFNARSEEIDVCNPIVRDYLDATDYATEYETLREMSLSSVDKQEAEVCLKIPTGAVKPCSFIFSSEEDFINFTTAEIKIQGKTQDGYTEVYYDIEKSLIPGNEYFWKVTDKDGAIIDYGKICVKDAPVRFINLDSVRNVRDIGGWTAENGKKVAYGLVYRGTRLNGNTGGGMLLLEEGKTKMRDELGVMTEIDLRTDSDSKGINGDVQSECFFGKVVDGKNDRNYLKCGINQYDAVITDSRNYDLLRQIFSCFADEKNYPIYFHCNAGADRTGTIAFLLNGLLGVSFEDLTRDFELTSTYSRRWRSASKDGAFDGTGANASGLFQQDSGNYVNWGKLYTDAMAFSEDGTLQNGIANFLKGRVGITDAQIARIKNILLK